MRPAETQGAGPPTLTDLSWIPGESHLFTLQTKPLLNYMNVMDLANNPTGAYPQPSDGHRQSLYPGKTELVPDEYYENRQGDLAPSIPVSPRMQRWGDVILTLPSES